MYSFEFAGANGDQPPHTTIHDMAVQYVAEIRKIQPAGEYILGGHCLGGLVAFDMAAKLEAMGKTVAALCLFESLPPSLDIGKGKFTESEEDAVLRSPELDAQILSALGMIFDQTGKQLARLPRELAERFEKLNRIHVEAGINYLASPVNAPIVLFRTSSHEESIFQEWRKLTHGEFSETMVPGHTFSMLTPPHVDVLAEQVAELLKSAR